MVRLSANPSSLASEKRDAAEGRADLMQAVLHEIDATILPRQLTVFFGQQAVADLTISHRRLLSLDLAEALSQDPHHNHTDQTSIAQTYALRLRLLASSPQNTGFRISRRACEITMETENCSAKQLSEILAPQQGESHLTSFLALISADANAWVLQNEQADQGASAGPDQLVQQLAALGDTDKSAKQMRGYALRMPDKTPSCMVLSLSSDIQVIVAWDHAETLLIALPSQHLAAATKAWRSIFTP